MTAAALALLVVLAAAHQWALFTAAAVTSAAAYAAGCWWWPLTRCWRCKGGRTNPGSNSRRWGKCRACGGSGERFRLGARLIHTAARRKER